jgi:hypothetical protein
VFHPKPYFLTISFDDCQNLQWQLGLVWLWRQKRLLIALWQIGAQVLVGACLFFQSHQFIYNVLEYIYADNISAFVGFYHSKQAWKSVEYCALI